MQFASGFYWNVVFLVCGFSVIFGNRSSVGSYSTCYEQNIWVNNETFDNKIITLSLWQHDKSHSHIRDHHTTVQNCRRVCLSLFQQVYQSIHLSRIFGDTIWQSYDET